MLIPMCRQHSKVGYLRHSLKIYVVILALCSLAVRAQEKLPLKLIMTTPMPGFTGDFDHFGLDIRGNRLFLAAEEHKTVEVFDLRTGKRIHSVEGFGQPLMMVYLPEQNHLVVTDGGDSAVQLVDCKTYKIIKTEVAGLPGSSNEGMVIDRSGKKLYVNLTGTDEVGVVDLETRQLVAKWPLPNAHVAHAIVLDEPDHRLFTATRQPPQFIVFNTDTGKVVTSLPCVRSEEHTSELQSRH